VREVRAVTTGRLNLLLTDGHHLRSDSCAGGARCFRCR
jgi:hypothetical protein